VIAESRQVDSGSADYFQQVAFVSERDLPAVDGKCLICFLIINSHFSIPPVLKSCYSIEAAGFFAGSALNAFIGVNYMYLTFFTADGANGTFAHTSGTSFTFFRIDSRTGKGAAFPGRADFFMDMRLIFFPEIFQS
jgi:hypothetical protein